MSGREWLEELQVMADNTIQAKKTMLQHMDKLSEANVAGDMSINKLYREMFIILTGMHKQIKSLETPTPQPIPQYTENL